MENKTLTIIKLILLATIAIILSVILVILLVNPKKGFSFFKISTKSELVYDEEVNGNIENITVNTKSADIQIEESTSEKINIKFYAEKDSKLSVKTTEKSLNITDDSSYFCIGICNFADKKIIISLPKDILYSLDLATASGDISVPNTNYTNINLKSISGDIKLLSATRATVQTTSGDIEINEIGDIDAKTVSGEININTINKRCELKTTSGDIEISLLNINENSKISTISGDVEIDRNSGSYIKTETISGEVEVRNNDRYANTELSIKTTSGDIEVED